MENQETAKKTEILPSKGELRIRKFFGILILLLSPLTILSVFTLFFIFALPLAIYLITFGIYLLKDKRYHFIADFFFTLIGFIFYFYFIAEFRYFLLLSPSALILVMGLILPLSASFFLLFGDILFKFQPLFKHKGSVGFLMFLIVFSGLFLYPMFQKIQYPQQSEHAMGIGANMFPKLKVEDAQYELNSEDKLWVYQIKIKNSSDKENAEILKIKAKKLPEGSFSIIAETIYLAPPFDNIKVSGGKKIEDRIIVEPLAEATVVITYPAPLLNIILQEEEGEIEAEFGEAK